MRILARTQMLSRYSTLESLDVAKQLGFDGVEICLQRLDWSLIDLNSLPIDAIRERIIELGLTPHSVSLHKDFIYGDVNFEFAQEAIKIIRQLGTEVFIIHGVPKRTKDEAEWKLMVDRTRTLVKIAEDHDVVLAEEFEPEFIVGSTADLLRLFDEIPSQNLAANLDLGHVFLCDPDPLQAIAQVGEKIVHSHIENMATGVHDHLLPQEGDMDISAYLQALADTGYDGRMSLDLYKYDYEAVAKDAVIYLRKLLAQIN